MIQKYILIYYTNKCLQLLTKKIKLQKINIYVKNVILIHQIKQIIIDIYKHLNIKKNQNDLKCSVTINEKNIEKKSYSCDCGKIYGYRQSLNVHKKKCQNNKKEIIISSNDETDNKDLILKLVFKILNIKN